MSKAMQGRFAVAVLLVSGLASAASGPLFLAQQGRLLNTDGTPAAGPVSVTFTLYDGASSITALWTETQSVTLTDGYFQAQLGKTTAFPAGTWTGAARFLGVKVGSDSEMTPREELVSVPFALLANDAIGDIHPASVTVNGIQVIKTDGTLTGAGVSTVTTDAGILGSVAGSVLALSANVGTSSGTLAAGDHGHPLYCGSIAGAAGLTSTIRCPTGTELTGGGCRGNSSTAVPYSSYPYLYCASPPCFVGCLIGSTCAVDSWSCSVASGTVTAFAMCCNTPVK